MLLEHASAANTRRTIVNKVQRAIEFAVTKGWTVVSLGDEQYTATKKKGLNPILAITGLIGLFFYCVPGLVILLIAYVTRSDKIRIINELTADDFIAAINASDKERTQIWVAIVVTIVVLGFIAVVIL